MSAGGGSDSNTDFDLNLAPIIDCFTVLITFMLVSASFISVSLFDAGFSPAEAVGDPTPPPVTVELRVLGGEKGYELVTKGKSDRKQTFTEMAPVVEQMQGLKTQYPSVTNITITADDGVEYERIVKAMEAAKPVYPAMVLGGF